MNDVKFEGVPVKIGGQEYIVPPLSIKGFKAMKGQIEALKNMAPGRAMTDEQIDGVMKIIHCALSRNYPELTLDQIEEMLDFGNIGPLINTITRAGGPA
jgi:hypothetical protein